jgi:hypothetical protein
MRNIFKVLLILGLVLSSAIPTVQAGTINAGIQDVTAYTASKYRYDGSLRLTHSSDAPALGFVAVRKNSNNQPHVPFGSTVSIPTTIDVGNYGYHYASSFVVKDTGIASTQSYYAIDIWWGFCRTDFNKGIDGDILGCGPNDTQYVRAKQFEEKSWNLTFYTP